MKPTFKLRSAKNNSASIYFVFSYGKEKRLRYATGYHLANKKNWDAKNERVKKVIEEIGSEKINKALFNLKAQIVEYYYDLEKAKKPINNDVLKDFCDEFFGKKVSQHKLETKKLFPFYDWYIEHYQKNPLMSSSKPLAKGTAKTYRNAYNILVRFNKELNYRLSYEKIGQKFYYDFLDWLQSNDYSTNYIGTQIKILKTILNASLELEHHSNGEHLKQYFKKPSETIKHIHLDLDELEKIYKLDLSNIKSIKISESLYLTSHQLDNARDLFLISANTGLRVSDFNRLKKENISNLNGRNYLQIVTKKTDNPVAVPINTMVQNILDKRGGLPPKKMPEQHINYALKELGKLAEINSTVHIEKTIGATVKTFEKKKYELITNHTARRSYCTNAYLAGVPVQDIMLTSAHKTEAIFYNYVKLSNLQRAIKTAEHPFYN